MFEPLIFQSQAQRYRVPDRLLRRRTSRSVRAIVGAALLSGALTPAGAGAEVPQAARPCQPGAASGGYCGDGGDARDARLNAPRDVSHTADGGILIADSANFVIRRIAGGRISTVAGLGVPGDRAPSTPTPVQEVALADPRGVAELPDRSFVIADAGLNAVLRVTSGTVRTIYRRDGALPVDVVSLGGGDVAIADRALGLVVRVSAGGRQQVLAAGLAEPVQLAVASGTGDPLARGLYVSQAAASPERPAGGHASVGDVVKLEPGGGRTVVAGPGAAGPGGALRFDRLTGVALGPDGSLLVADTGTVRAVSATTVSTVMGRGQPLSAPIELGEVSGIAYANGLLLAADARRDQISSAGLAAAPSADPAEPQLQASGAARYGRRSVIVSGSRRPGGRPRCVRGSFNNKLTQYLGPRRRREIAIDFMDPKRGNITAFLTRGRTTVHAGPLRTRRKLLLVRFPKKLARGQYQLELHVKTGVQRGCLRRKIEF